MKLRRYLCTLPNGLQFCVLASGVHQALKTAQTVAQNQGYYAVQINLELIT